MFDTGCSEHLGSMGVVCTTITFVLGHQEAVSDSKKQGNNKMSEAIFFSSFFSFIMLLILVLHCLKLKLLHVAPLKGL